MNLTPAVKNILIACIVLFVGTILLERQNISLINILGLHYPTNRIFNPYQLITHMFMHGGLTHILFNMFGLVTFGVVLERVLGIKKFVSLYFFSGLGAILVHFIAQAIIIHQFTGGWFLTDEVLERFIASNPPQEVYERVISNYQSIMVGASGCLYGISAAFAMLFPNTELYIMFIPIPMKAKYIIPGFIALDLFLGVSNFNWDPVAHFAHVGGGLFGFGLTYYWRKFDKNNFY
jgi:membrane associated rhomboid family serine protease